MKIKIEIDLEPDEFPLASELIKALNSISKNIKVNYSTHHKPTSSNLSTSPISTPPISTQHDSIQPNSIQPDSTRPNSTVPNSIQPNSINDSIQSDNKTSLKTILLQLEKSPKQIEQVAQQLQKIIQQEKDQMKFVDEFFDTYCSVVFDPTLVLRQISIAPFIFLLASNKIPDQFKTQIRDKLLEKILKFLTIKRSINCNRAEVNQFLFF